MRYLPYFLGLLFRHLTDWYLQYTASDFTAMDPAHSKIKVIGALFKIIYGFVLTEQEGLYCASLRYCAV